MNTNKQPTFEDLKELVIKNKGKENKLHALVNLDRARESLYEQDNPDLALTQLNTFLTDGRNFDADLKDEAMKIVEAMKQDLPEKHQEAVV